MERASINGMCRCCASEGAFKDIKSSYHWMGEEEVYGEMLKRCFDIDLSSTEDSEGGICEVCITQLRNASNFKKQVLQTEEQFKQKLQMKFFKPTIVKVELQDENNQSDDNISNDDGFSGTEFEVSIKKEGTEEPKSKKRPSPAKASTSRAKKPKANEDSAETSTPKRNVCEHASIDLTEVKNSKEGAIAKVNKDDQSVNLLNKKISYYLRRLDRLPLHSKMKDLDVHLHNARTILINSNATPIRCYSSSGYKCAFCCKTYENPSDLKRHTLQSHDDNVKKEFMKGAEMRSYVVKLDITGMRCRICDAVTLQLEDFVDHLETEHDIFLYRDLKSHILPFSFEGDTLRCVLCAKRFLSFKLLQEHMSTHFSNYVCELCDARFVHLSSLKMHKKQRHTHGEFACNFCGKVFVSNLKRLHHEKSVHIIHHMRNKCPYCPEKFVIYKMKLAHMVEKHGKKPIVYECMACDKVFNCRQNLTHHTKKFHLMERKHACARCDKKFYLKTDLKYHMMKHTGEKRYKCDVCTKGFTEKYVLRQHMRIHTNDRRFKCDQCGQAFIQKCSWKLHLKSKHGIIL